MKTVTKAEFLGMVGHEYEPSPWLAIDQERVDRFADATDDHQFIHVDPVKAAATPFGTTVAHGYLTLSLLPYLSQQVAVVPEGLLMGINYGIEKLRFPQPVRVGSEVRLRSKVLAVSEKLPGRILVKTEVQVEIRGEAKPALVAVTLGMFVVEA